MTNPETDLLGDPLPEPLPENIQLTDWDQLTGHTIKAAIDICSGRRRAEVVLVTATNCFLALEVEPEDCDSAELKVVRGPYGGGEGYNLHDFVSADMLHTYGCISDSVRNHLRTVESERKKKQAADRAARLRADAERTEREAGLVPAAAQSSNGSM
jgi:hypothetical protein